jgi:hypothetical protein
MPALNPLRFLLLGTAILLAIPSMALARGARGPSQSQIKAMQAYQKQMQQEYEMAVKAEQAEQKAFLDKFDTNHDGKIAGAEKGPADKFLRERRLGKAAPLTAGSAGGGGSNPFAGFADGVEGKREVKNAAKGEAKKKK